MLEAIETVLVHKLDRYEVIEFQMLLADVLIDVHSPLKKLPNPFHILLAVETVLVHRFDKYEVIEFHILDVAVAIEFQTFEIVVEIAFQTSSVLALI